MNENAKHALKMIGVGVAIGGTATAAYILGKKAGIKLPKSFWGPLPAKPVHFMEGVEHTYPAMLDRQTDILRITYDTLSDHKDALTDVVVTDTAGVSEPLVDFLAKALDVIGLHKV